MFGIPPRTAYLHTKQVESYIRAIDSTKLFSTVLEYRYRRYSSTMYDGLLNLVQLNYLYRYTRSRLPYGCAVLLFNSKNVTLSEILRYEVAKLIILQWYLQVQLYQVQLYSILTLNLVQLYQAAVNMLVAPSAACLTRGRPVTSTYLQLYLYLFWCTAVLVGTDYSCSYSCIRQQQGCT